MIILLLFFLLKPLSVHYSEIFETEVKIFLIFNRRTSVSGVLVSLKLDGVQIQQEVSVEQLEVQVPFSK